VPITGSGVTAIMIPVRADHRFRGDGDHDSGIMAITRSGMIPIREEGIDLVEVLGHVTMQVFVREHLLEYRRGPITQVYRRWGTLDESAMPSSC
jgi:hypothetical protein